MRRWRWTSLGVVLALMIGGPATAQFIEDARRSLDLSPDPLARSARLLGMGRLSWVVEDSRNRIAMWDFARNPTGIVDADSLSTLEFRPVTVASSSVRDITGGLPTRERQDLAAREVRLGYEAWHRRPGATTYGVIGSIAELRLDRPFNEDVEQRTHFAQPRATVIVSGPMPRVLSDRMRFALELVTAAESNSERFREIVRNPVGDYIDQDGQIGVPPDFFTLDEKSIRTLGGGGAVSYRFGEWLTAALGAGRTGNLIKGNNAGGRYLFENREERPISTGQATLIGRLGDGIEWGADARAWKSSSVQSWLFTLSTGTASVPIAGRGGLLSREENGSTLRTRARWTLGPVEVGAGFNARNRDIDIAPPPVDDVRSFNYFRNFLFNLTGADTLELPDSVVANRFEDRGWEFGAGAAWHLPFRDGVLGVEFHRRRDFAEQRLNGKGPERIGWDVRGGLELRTTEVLTLRTGYIYGWDDRDELTQQNEFVSHAVTLGLGLKPHQGAWSVESGYALEWERADYGDPGRPRTNRHRLAGQVIWSY